MKIVKQNTKKQLEFLIMEYFRNVYADFPKGELNAAESPDFILSISPRKKIGIELTRLYTGYVETNNENAFYTRQLQNELVQNASEIFERNSALKLFVKVYFLVERPVVQAKVLALSVFCANAVREAVKNKKQDSFFRIQIKNNLPEEIRGILVVAHPVLKSSFWEVVEVTNDSSELPAKIIQLIAGKKENLLLYHKKWLNQYWLLITSNNPVHFDVVQQIAGFNIHQQFSRFHKVFLFDLFTTEIFQIV